MNKIKTSDQLAKELHRELNLDVHTYRNSYYTNIGYDRYVYRTSKTNIQVTDYHIKNFSGIISCINSSLFNITKFNSTTKEHRITTDNSMQKDDFLETIKAMI